jgi:GTP pyrophosphokinase
VIAKIHPPPEKILDVEWGAETSKSFDVSIELTVANQRGVLAKVAAEIAAAGSNIDNVSMDEDEGIAYTAIHFTLQVTNRLHLAQLMRNLRRIPEVVRITRVKG